MKNIIITIFFLVAINAGFGQKAKNSLENLHFNSINNAGLQSGQNGESFAIQTINGIRYKSWSAGIGVGIDYYGERSVPLFVDINKTLLNKPRAPFIYLQGGINLPWLNDREKNTNGFIDTKPGRYFDVGAGLKIKLQSSQNILLSLGYSQKVSQGSQQVQSWPFGVFLPVTTTENYVNTFNRLILKIGYQF